MATAVIIDHDVPVQPPLDWWRVAVEWRSEIRVFDVGLHFGTDEVFEVAELKISLSGEADLLREVDESKLGSELWSKITETVQDAIREYPG
jgi:hypothetical protein